jgi:hypothetical protein
MNSTLMQKSQRSGDSIWSLPAKTSQTLHVGPGARVLQVQEGRLWLTTSGNADEAATDLWLEAGESVELADGLEVVMEAWPAARYQLMVPPSACKAGSPARSPLTRAAGWLADLVVHRTPPGLSPSRSFAH